MDSESTGGGVYRGPAGQTRKRILHVSCDCEHAYTLEVYRSVNVGTDPELAERLIHGELDGPTACPACGVASALQLPLVYHDPNLPFFGILLPETMRHAELQVRAALLKEIDEEAVDLPAYVRRAEAVVGPQGLLGRLEQLAGQPAQVDPALAAELDQRRARLERWEEELHAREEDLLGKQEDLIAQQAAHQSEIEEMGRMRADLEREREALRVLALDLAGQSQALHAQRKRSASGAEAAGEDAAGQRGSPSLEGRPDDEIDRWRAGDERAAAFFHEGRVFLAARPGPALARYLAESPRLAVQLREVEGLSLVLLLAVPASHDPEHGRIIWWALDVGRREDRALLAQLGEAFVVELDLYDDESRPVASWRIEEPLAENVRRILERAGADPVDGRAFAAAVADLGQLPDVELLGRKQHNFLHESFIDLPSPAATRLALGIVTYWSEPANEDYLLLIKSFAVSDWAAIRERVIRRSLEFGLRLDDSLADFAVQQGLAPSRDDLLRTMVANFAEVSLRIKASDLDPVQEWQNWNLLLADCVQQGIAIEPQIEELAAACGRKAQQGASIVDETAPGGDLSTLGEAELLALLSERGQRRDAALELCDRGHPSVATDVFAAVRNMTRAEVARVLPAMVQLGGEVVPPFVQGLGHRKSFIRQGCALGLGALKASAATVPLIEMLLGEPTRIWMEAARALGDIGGGTLAALRQAIERADGEGRERVAWAMAHVGLAPVGLRAVQALAATDDVAISKAARRALQVLPQARSNDSEVRGDRPLREQTIVRAFTRRFFECVPGDVNELTEADIVEQEEVLEDADIVDEELEVDDEDILEPAGK